MAASVCNRATSPESPRGVFDVGKLTELWNPWNAWTNCPTPKMVAEAIRHGWLKTIRTTKGEPAEYHAGRIAYLLVNGWDDPIEIEYCHRLYVHDGNHRLAAAQYRGDRKILAIWSGYVDRVESLLFKT